MLVISEQRRKRREKKKDTKDLSLTSVLLSSFRFNSAAVNSNNHLSKSVSLSVVSNYR